MKLKMKQSFIGLIMSFLLRSLAVLVYEVVTLKNWEWLALVSGISQEGEDQPGWNALMPSRMQHWIGTAVGMLTRGWLELLKWVGGLWVSHLIDICITSCKQHVICLEFPSLGAVAHLQNVMMRALKRICLFGYVFLGFQAHMYVPLHATRAWSFMEPLSPHLKASLWTWWRAGRWQRNSRHCAQEGQVRDELWGVVAVWAFVACLGRFCVSVVCGLRYVVREHLLCQWGAWQREKLIKQASLL